MKHDNGVTEGDTYHKVRTKLAYVRFRLASVTNPTMKLLLRKEEQALKRQLDMCRRV